MQHGTQLCSQRWRNTALGGGDQIFGRPAPFARRQSTSSAQAACMVHVVVMTLPDRHSLKSM